ncbi:MAG: aminotransferase class V-fold PLP-dependent enzyme, partial [Aggregatilineales bacterium]
MQNTYSSENYEALYQEFIAAHPDYETTIHLDTLRETDYARLDKNGQVYLDYTGGGLYAQCQLDEHFKMMAEGVWGNPHSHNPTSLAMTERVEASRAYVLEYFNADPAEYDVVFTANASAALKLVGESFPFKSGSRFLALADNHNSVNGIREFARNRGATSHYIETIYPDMRIPADTLRESLQNTDTDVPNLFALPGQSNYSGVKHNLDWFAEAKAQGWTTLLDA